MIGFLVGKIKVIAIVAAISASAIGYHALTVSKFESKISLYESENTELRVENKSFSEKIDFVLAENDSNIESLTAEINRKDLEIQQYLLDNKNLKRLYLKVSEETGKLRLMLADHDLEYLASQKPKLIENRINSATKRVFSELEELSSHE